MSGSRPELEFVTAARQPDPAASRTAAPALICPGCTAPLSPAGPSRPGPGGSYGLLGCDCGIYPVVAGIPIIMAALGPDLGFPTRQVIRWIRDGELGKALAAATREANARRKPEPRSRWRKRLARVLPGQSAARGDDSGDGDTAPAMFGRSAVQLLADRFTDANPVNREIRTYFTFRLTHAEHFAALGLTTLFPRDPAPILDVGAGAGHLAAHLVTCGHTVVGIDRDFHLLLLAKLTVAPRAEFVCADLEAGLPFAPGAFAGAACVNTLHFIRNKARLIADLAVILRHGSPLTIGALRHSGNPGPVRNFAISPPAYARLLEAFRPKLYGHRDVLSAYLEGRTPTASEAREPDALTDQRFIEIAGCLGENPEGLGKPFGHWPHAAGTLGLNPLYQPVRETHPGSPRFRLREPSQHFAEDNRQLLDRLPAEVEVSRETLGALERGERTAAMEPLIESLVLVEFPAGYSRVADREADHTLA